MTETKKKATKKQVGFIYKLLGLLGAKDEKGGLALIHSGGRTTRLSELEQDEVRTLIDFLKKQTNLPDTPGNRQRRKILSMAHEMRWKLPDGRVDIARVNAWCTKYGHAHKPLDDYNPYELPMLVTQFERMYQSFLKGI